MNEKFEVYVLHKLIPEYANCPLLRNALNQSDCTIEKIRDWVSVEIVCWEETKQNNVIKNSTISGNKMIARTVKSAKTDPNSYYSNNLKTNKDIKKNFECYKEILSLAICKTASQLLKSKQKIDKILSLKGIISNNLNNISNSKTTPKELWDIIKGDKSITVYVLNTMAKLNIIDITNDHKGVTIFDHKLAEFAELTFNEEEFKQKISGAIE